jgi:hypothetical protein
VETLASHGGRACDDRPTLTENCEPYHPPPPPVPDQAHRIIVVGGIIFVGVAIILCYKIPLAAWMPASGYAGQQQMQHANATMQAMQRGMMSQMQQESPMYAPPVNLAYQPMQNQAYAPPVMQVREVVR